MSYAQCTSHATLGRLHASTRLCLDPGNCERHRFSRKCASVAVALWDRTAQEMHAMRPCEECAAVQQALPWSEKCVDCGEMSPHTRNDRQTQFCSSLIWCVIVKMRTWPQRVPASRCESEPATVNPSQSL